ncbi:hypothetical protein ACFL5T_01730 [Gemmatimonadota bacterium]
MRPEKDKRRTLKSYGRARARMLLKDGLWWLPGVPLGQGPDHVDWLALPRLGDPEVRRARLSAHEIRHATENYTALANHFPRALPKVVADYDRWVDGLPRLLDHLKGPIHEKKPLLTTLVLQTGDFPEAIQKRAATLTRGRKFLARAVGALSWYAYLDSDEFESGLDWVESFEAEITVLARDLPMARAAEVVVSLWEIERRAGRGSTAPLLRLLGDPRAFTLRLENADEYAQAWSAWLEQKTSRPPDGQPELVGDCLLALIHDLLAVPDDDLPWAMDVLAAVLPQSPYDDWQLWLAGSSDLVGRARQVFGDKTGLERSVEPGASVAEALATEIRFQRLNVPPRVRVANIQDSLRRAWFLRPEQRQHILAILLAVSAEAGRYSIRPPLLAYWVYWLEQEPVSASAYLAASRAYLEEHAGVSGVLQPWESVIRGWQSETICASGASSAVHDRSWLTDHLLGEDYLSEHYPEILDAFAILGADHELECFGPDWTKLVDLVVVGRDVRTAAERFTRLICEENGPLHRAHLPLMQLADRLEDGSTVSFDRWLRTLCKALSGRTRAEADLVASVEALLDGGCLDLVRQWLGDRLHTQLIAAGSEIRLLREADVTVPLAEPTPQPVDPLPEWVITYPDAYHEELLLLAALDPDAENRARRLLGDDYPQQVDLRAEIAELEARLREPNAAPHLSTRLANLQERMAAGPSQASAVRERRLLERLRRAVRKVRFEGWCGELRDRFEEHVMEALDVPELPRWGLEPEIARLLRAVLSLPKDERSIGLRLLRERCGPPPWDLRADPRNQAFVGRMERRGIDMDPWLDAGGLERSVPVGDRVVKFGLLDDPLDTLFMGERFGTCLSLESECFYSAVSNAADINKKVLVARDGTGPIMARCLLALSHAGSLLVFHPYRHDLDFDFKTGATDFIQDLSVRMGAAIAVGPATIANLVAPRWLNDGPVDFAGESDRFAEDSDFREGLKTVEPSHFLALIGEYFGPEPRLDLLLPAVMELPEFTWRPELLPSVKPFLRRAADLPPTTWITAAHMAHDAADEEFLGWLMRERVTAVMPGLLRANLAPAPSVNLFIDQEPVLALQALRSTRARSVRSDAEEPYWRRRFYARAYTRLNRPKQAARLSAVED